MIISCSLSEVLLTDDGEPVFLFDRDGEAAGTFSRHSPEGRRFRMTDHKETTKVQACPSVVVRCCHRVDKPVTATVPEDTEDIGVDG